MSIRQTPAYMEALQLLVVTLDDDKDDNLYLKITIKDVYGDRVIHVEDHIGLDQTWPDRTTRTIRIPAIGAISTFKIPYSDRLLLSMHVELLRKNSDDKKWNWNLELSAVFDNGELRPVVINSGRLEWGWPGKPLEQEFPFNV